MAYAIVHFFPGGTKEHYDAAMAVVHPGEGQLPDGQSWERFSEVATPRAHGLEGAFPTSPQETTFEVHTFASRPH